MAEEQQTYLTPEEQLSSLSDTLISSIIRKDDVSKENRRFLFGQVTNKIFKNENYVIFTVFEKFKERNITPTEDFLKMYLMRNLKLLHESQAYIDLKAFADLDESPDIGYIIATLKQFNRLLTIEPVNSEDFRLALEKYKTLFSQFEINRAYGQAKIILYDGLNVGRKLYQGYDDSVAYVKKVASDIDAVMDHTTGIGFIDSSKEALVDDETVKPELIGDFGLIHELNKNLGGYYTSLFYNVMAPTKGGKSKFTTRAIHNIVVEHGYNASVWAHEGGYKAWWAQLRAIHFEYMYIRNRPDNEKVAPLSQKDILYGKYPSEEIRALEEASRIDLFTNPEYGNIYMIDRPFLGETFIEEIETSVQLNNSKVVLIDYLQLITSNDRNKSKSQVIGRAYQDFLAYCKKRNVMGISPSQFTQDFMKEMANSREGQAHEVRTAGGESSEIIRTPDINIALYASTEDLIRHEMTIMSVPSRLAEPFPDIKIYVDLCSCVFSSMNAET